jgi:hypothetical protein
VEAESERVKESDDAADVRGKKALSFLMWFA